MPDLGRIFVILGAALLVVGAAILLLSRLGINLGCLPGDLQFEGSGFTCLVPLATSIVLSILLTIGLNLLARFFDR